MIPSEVWYSYVWTSSIFSSPSCTVVGHTEAKTKQYNIWTTVDFCIILMARASSDRCVVRDEPGRADVSLGRSLLCETEQKDQQEAICFHDVIPMTIKQHTQSNTLTSNVQLINIQNYNYKCHLYLGVALHWA